MILCHKHGTDFKFIRNVVIKTPDGYTIDGIEMGCPCCDDRVYYTKPGHYPKFTPGFVPAEGVKVVERVEEY